MEKLFQLIIKACKAVNPVEIIINLGNELR